MGDSGKTAVFVFLIVFWTLLTIASNMLDLNLSTGSVSELLPNPDQKQVTDSGFKAFLSGLFDNLDDIPFIKYFVPLMRIMSFQYSDQIPVNLSIFLAMTGVLSLIALIGILK